MRVDDTNRLAKNKDFRYSYPDTRRPGNGGRAVDFRLDGLRQPKAASACTARRAVPDSMVGAVRADGRVLRDTRQPRAWRYGRKGSVFQPARGQSALAGVLLCAQMAAVRIHLDIGSGCIGHRYRGQVLQKGQNRGAFAGSVCCLDDFRVVS